MKNPKIENCCHIPVLSSEDRRYFGKCLAETVTARSVVTNIVHRFRVSQNHGSNNHT